jgi:hypothetical protein
MKKNSRSVLVGNIANTVKKLYCTCGFIGEVEQTSCPECNKEMEVDLVSNSFEKTSLLEISERDNAVFLELTLGFYQKKDKNVRESDAAYLFNNRIYKLVMNKNTGVCELFIKKGKMVLSNTNQGGIQGQFYDDIKDIEGMTLKIIDTLFKTRGIMDIKAEIFVDPNFFGKAFTFLLYPALQFFKTHLIYTPCNKKHLDILKCATSEIKLFHELTGHKSKRIREIAKNADIFNFLLIWGPIIKEVDNLLYFTEQISFSSAIFFEKYNPSKYFYIGLHLIKDFHKGLDEKIWVHRLMKCMKVIAHYGLDVRTINNYIEDIGKMYHEIINANQHYTVLFNGDIRKLHDNLSIDQRKIKVPNKRIRYSEIERTWEKKIDKEKEFILAPDTHYLVEVGSKMNICVGSYADFALSKRCDIIVLKENEEPVVCIELRGDKLIQAKMKHNKRPIGAYREEVLRWCRDNEIKYDNCYDIA